ncbi:single-stranded-DNA-specific exonuclease RecJ [Chloroflexota bacterium]
MKTIEKKWQIESLITPEADKELHTFPPLFRQILFNRGFATDESARDFLKAKGPSATSPWLLSGMDLAIERIAQAINSHELIIIYGDFDVDGVTATVLLVDVLRSLGANVEAYIPNRFDEGYGLNIDALEKIHQDGCRVVITVDCGIRSLEEVKHACEIGLDIIITDHHNPGDQLPNAYAVINPKKIGDQYPDKDLAGVGVAYKIAEALMEKFPGEGMKCENLLDLVALGTVADLAPLTGENRRLVRMGLHQIRQTSRQGLFSLAKVAGIELRNCTAGDIGYVLGPRLNASGRLESALASYELLMTRDIKQAGILAQKMEMQNRERRKITQITLEEAENLVTQQDPDDFLLLAADPSFNAGVVGLVASRLSEKFYRPVVVCTIEDDTTRGSCRSIPEFHITDALDQCADLLVRFGGHAAAAGFTIQNQNFKEFQERLKEIAKGKLFDCDLRPTLCADREISISELNNTVLEQLEWFEPTGYGNPEVVFVSKDVQVLSKRTVGRNNSHLKLMVTDGFSKFDAIGFNLGYFLPDLTRNIDIMYTFEMNEFNGRRTLQLRIKDIKRGEDRNN